MTLFDSLVDRSITRGLYEGARPGGIEKVLSLKPKILTMVEEEEEANHKSPVFVEALHYHSNLFDSLEGHATKSGLGYVRVVSGKTDL
ncbi:hypothetical protein V6N13_044912 [Hibiscus sabdariffa]|uniref:Uncharacterized protein n=1 Tax=Hibiscus sabdariffa TaxID=183260 RepID=A0ABR2RJL5_9ROSI